MVIGIVMGQRSASLALRVPAVPITVRLYALFQIERGQFISGFEPAALELLLNAIETPKAVISGAVLDDYHASESIVLKEIGLLKPHGHEEVSVSGADHDDAPVTLSWSAEDGGLGYFGPTAGWVTVAEDRIARFRVDFPVLLARRWPLRTPA